MPRIEFEADTEEQLLALAWRWVMGPQHRPGELVPTRPTRRTFGAGSSVRSSTPFVARIAGVCSARSRSFPPVTKPWYWMPG